MMTEDHASTGPGTAETGSAEPEYVETYVEVVDNRRRVIVLALILLVLLAFLGVLAPLLYNAIRPPGTPTAAETGEGLTWVRSIYGWGDTAAEMLVGPVSVAVAPDGTYWTVSQHRVIVGFDANGRSVGLVRPSEGTEEGQIQSIEGIAFAPDGGLYVVDYGNAKVLKYDPSGEFEGEVKVAFPQKVAVGDGVVVVSAIPGVALFDPEDGTLLSQWGGRGSELEEFDGARGVAFGPDGTLFVADSLNKRVKAYTQDGELLWSFPSEEIAAAAREAAGPTGEEPTEPDENVPFQLPSGLTVDAAGRVIVVDPFEFEIIALDPRNGSELARWGGAGAADGKFGYPSDIAYDAATDLFVIADTANDRLQVVELSGSGGGAGAVVARFASTPVWICAIPLFVLLALIAMAVLRSRRSRREPAAAG